MIRLFRTECRTVQRALWDYTNHRLPEGVLEKVEHHLPTCEACRHELKSLRQAQHVLTSYKSEPVPVQRTDWSDLQQRLLTEGNAPALRAAFQNDAREERPAESENRAEDRRRRRPGETWQGSLLYAGGFTAFLITAALGYRFFPLTGASARHEQPKAVVSAGPGPLEFAPSQGRPPAGTVAYHKPQTEADALNPAKNSRYNGSAGREHDATSKTDAYDDSNAEEPDGRGGYHMTPAVLRTNTPVKGAKKHAGKPAETSDPDGMRFVKHSPTSEEAAPRQDAASRYYVMDQIAPVSRNGVSRRFVTPGTLVPSNEDDAAY